MPNQGSAYDFALFEPKRRGEPEQAPKKQPNIIELPKERLEENRRPKNRPGKVIPAFLAFLVVSGILASYVNGQAQLAQLSDQIGTAQKTLTEQQNIYSQLKIRSDATLSMAAVENYATQKLGMQKTSQSQVTTVELAKGDKSQVVAKDAGGNWLERAWEAIKAFLS